MEKRASLRFNKVIPVDVSSEDFGELACIARNISAGGMLIETASPLPLGSEVRVHFRISGSHEAISARAEVKHHYAFNYGDCGEVRWARGMGVRFIEFVEEPSYHPNPYAQSARTLH